ncbi:chitin synthase [Rhizoctonia solani]|uniref:chitin synthase n=1 Tax=Rhizoctonia solani TaxID=456999 RepID=A0A8H8NNJ9_9AGAM|nr:chitin synthase [Rhizoctonia solani]QRW16570.1 chitin synthase [Rhizoctonia solani]
MGSRSGLETHDLTALISSTGGSTVYPNEETILNVLQTRFRADEPYVRIAGTTLVVVNPLKSLASVNDLSATEYAKLSRAVEKPQLQPHVYELAARVYAMMKRTGIPQTVVFRGITGSGKSHTASLFSSQLVRLSARSGPASQVAAQLGALQTVLTSFGHAKTSHTASASRFSCYTELYFDSPNRAHLTGAIVHTFGLDKRRLSRLAHDERTFHVFYQLLAGATAQERDSLVLGDMTDYNLLASSGCYRLPAGPFSDDALAMLDLRDALKTLAFKPKHITSIWSLLTAILTLGNIQFADHGGTTNEARGESAYVTNPEVLEQAATLLGVPSEQLSDALTVRTNYIRRDLFTSVLNAPECAKQTEQLAMDLYAILFAYVIESANHRIAPRDVDQVPESAGIIAMLDTPGHQARSNGAGTLLASALSENGFEEFCANFQAECINAFVLRHAFDDTIGLSSRVTSDGISLPTVQLVDNSACVELLRGVSAPGSVERPGGVIGLIDKAARGVSNGSGLPHSNDLLQDMAHAFGVHASYITSPSSSAAADQALFGIAHYAGSVSYDVRDFVARDVDTLDPGVLNVLRRTNEPFIEKLIAGPAVRVEMHARERGVVVRAQVGSRALRMPNSRLRRSTENREELDPEGIYPVMTQLSYALGVATDALGGEGAEQDGQNVPVLWNVTCIRPNDSQTPNSFDKRRVRAQIRALGLREMVERKIGEVVIGVPRQEGDDRYGPGSGWEREGVEGRDCVWLGYEPWKALEDQVRTGEPGEGEEEPAEPVRSYARQHDRTTSAAGIGDGAEDSLLPENSPFADANAADWDRKASYATLPTPPSGTAATTPGTPELGVLPNKEKPVMKGHKEEVAETRVRKVWRVFTWMCTWWIPTYLLIHVGRMKRPDIRQAWREKVTICMLIFFACAFVIFYIIIFGKLLCPQFDKAWNVDELSGHAAENDYWVAVRGIVYDITDFWKGSHSDITAQPSSNDLMQELWGQDLTSYFPIPLTLGCSGLVSDTTMTLGVSNQSTITVPTAIHTSGSAQSVTSSQLASETWYTNRFLPKMDEYYKGTLVWDWKTIESNALNDDTGRTWAVWDENVYDLSDYFYTIDQNPNQSKYEFIDSRVTALFRQQPGQDITKNIRRELDKMSSEDQAKIYACMKNVFYVGKTDFRKTPKCQFSSVLLIVFAAIIAVTILAKFLAALQLTGKRSPEAMDKFVICQVPAYTEDEESLRRTIDSLTVLKYDDKRKLLFIICDGNIIGSGNDRSTPRICLDILGVDPALDPEPLRFRSVGEGSKQLNYGKVYSGLYEFEGHVVPYIVVVKTGKPSETSKPGNRGKRDSQILLLHYLNRVHFDAPMSPLQLEIYHQMRNVIGIDPAFYEYIFMVDADTTVTPDSLNRLVACTADDSQIIGICGETKLDNEEGSWWTMIQIYEYYISHHLAKAFESLFGSVTCLPGCFSMYRIRTADKGRPIIISNRIIDDYNEGIVDTLHKKNLLHLGEDRYLTTLMMKHFPTFKMKFTPDAIAHTIAPDRWSILLSQRRRWINSTIHNLCELVVLPELCGICCFSMRFIVFLDLVGTIILPATCVYLVYLIVITATGSGPIPYITLVMLAATYGLQAIIFLLKREFMLIGWMIIYLFAYPVYSFFLPIYSFWSMDDFSWGNTRLIQNEGGKKVVVLPEDEGFDESMIPLKKFSEYEAEAWETGSHKSVESKQTGYTQAKSLSAQDFARRRAQETGFAASYHAGSQSGDYYRDTNKMSGAGSMRGHGSNSGHGPGLRSQGSNPNLQQQYLMPQFSGMGGMGGMGVNMPWMGSQAGSDYGGHGAAGSMNMGMMGMNPYMMGSMGSMGMVNNPYAASTMGGVPRNSVMTNLNMFGGGLEAQQTGNTGLGLGGGLGTGTGGRPMSTFSMATTVNPLAGGPSQSTNPSDEELLTVLKHYLASQDLFSVTKKSAREAVAQRFPKADLSDRKDFLNKSIDTILTENA